MKLWISSLRIPISILWGFRCSDQPSFQIKNSDNRRREPSFQIILPPSHWRFIPSWKLSVRSEQPTYKCWLFLTNCSILKVLNNNFESNLIYIFDIWLETLIVCEWTTSHANYFYKIALFTQKKVEQIFSRAILTIFELLNINLCDYTTSRCWRIISIYSYF